MQLIYMDVTGAQLGSIQYTSFNEILLPSFSDTYNPYVVANFITPPTATRNWKVSNLQVTPGVATVTLEAVTSSPKSIQAMAADAGKSAKIFLKQFDVVEVDFGFHSKALDTSNCSTRRNTTYPNALMSGEMHKRRPCIVLKTFTDVAQVIPLTSKTVSTSDSRIPIDMTQIRGILERYYVNTHALIESLQSVSYDRIYRLKGPDGLYTNRHHTICHSDREAIKVGLAALYTPGVRSQISGLQDQLQKSSKERMTAVQKNEKLKDEKSQLQQELDSLKQSIYTIGEKYDMGTDIQGILDKF